jgi:malonyl CoA-acyl carrier protein transacylase
METARTQFIETLTDVRLSIAEAPVVSNGDARPYADGDGWRPRLADHLVQPVRWRQSLGTLVELGATDLVEVGPGSTLAGLAKRTLAAGARA